MKGRPMRGYVVFPKAWHKQSNKIKPWVIKSLCHTAAMPIKNTTIKKKKTA
jgi:hypothetical protein